jgi:acetyltransferase-like isoleucine patch superfamily enzyme
MSAPKPRSSHGTGRWTVGEFAAWGPGTVVEQSALVFRAEHVSLGSGVYVGHLAILKAYPTGPLRVGDGTWIGEQAYLNSAGGLTVGQNVGVGVGVRVITSMHGERGRGIPILHSELEFAPVEIGDDSDLGVGVTVLPGVRIGRGVQVGAGAVVTADLDDFVVAAGVPARVLRVRPGEESR